MGPKTEELIGVLDQLATLLESDGAVRWSVWMRKARARLLDSDYSGIEYLLSAYGGMGSLNDLVLGQSRVDGLFAWRPGYVELNETFSELREHAAQLARAIRHSDWDRDRKEAALTPSATTHAEGEPQQHLLNHGIEACPRCGSTLHVRQKSMLISAASPKKRFAGEERTGYRRMDQLAVDECRLDH